MELSEEKAYPEWEVEDSEQSPSRDNIHIHTPLATSNKQLKAMSSLKRRCLNFPVKRPRSSGGKGKKKKNYVQINQDDAENVPNSEESGETMDLTQEFAEPTEWFELDDQCGPLSRKDTEKSQLDLIPGQPVLMQPQRTESGEGWPRAAPSSFGQAAGHSSQHSVFVRPDPFPTNLPSAGKYEAWLFWKQQMAMAIELSREKSQRIKAGYVMVSGGEEIRRLIYSLDLLPDEDKVEDGYRFYDSLMHNLDMHFKGTADRTIDLGVFNSLKQEEKEGARDFRLRICRQARLCGIENQDVIIKSKFIDGMRDKLTAQRAYMEDWELDKVVEVASRGEAAEAMKPKGWLSNRPRSVEVSEVAESFIVDRLKETPRAQHPFKRPGKQERCGNCGLVHRVPGKCPAKDKKCSVCDKIGHFKLVCRSKAAKGAGDKQKTEPEPETKQVPKRF